MATFIQHRAGILLLASTFALVACEKEITVDLPITEPRIVVEGTIETGAPPIVILTRTQSFFAPTDLNSIAASFVTDASVSIYDGTTTHTLDRICSGQLTEEQIALIATLTGLDVTLLSNANICAWTKLTLLGEPGRSYRLNIQADGKDLSATTTIPQAVQLDSLWFRLAQQQPDDDSLGFIWARLSDPDTLGNHYRWLAKRINAGPDGGSKDDSFVPPFFSVFEDRFVNGLSFDFNFNRGARPYSEAEDDENEERGFFKRGDTVVVKLVSLDRASFVFYNSFQNNVASQGDVFSNPANVVSNIDGGLGAWSGWGVPVLDTVVCQP